MNQRFLFGVPLMHRIADLRMECGKNVTKGAYQQRRPKPANCWVDTLHGDRRLAPAKSPCSLLRTVSVSQANQTPRSHCAMLPSLIPVRSDTERYCSIVIEPYRSSLRSLYFLFFAFLAPVVGLLTGEESSAFGLAGLGVSSPSSDGSESDEG